MTNYKYYPGLLKMILFLFLLNIIILIPVYIYAEELQVVTEEWRPYNYLENGEIKGISTDIVKEVLNRAGIKYKITVYPWARAYNMALKQENVLIYTLIRIEEREKLFKWVRPIGKGGTTSLYRLKKNYNINPKTINDAKKYRIIANNNSMDHLWLISHGFQYIETPSRPENCIKMFMYERAEIIAFDSAVMEYEFKHLGYSTDAIVNIMPLFKTHPYMALSRSTSDSILKKLRKAFDDLLKEGKIKYVN